MGDLDDQIKLSAAALADELANPRCSSALDGRLAIANLLKEGLDKVAEQLFAIADEDMVGFHPTPTAGVCCASACMRAFLLLGKQEGCHYRKCENRAQMAG